MSKTDEMPSQRGELLGTIDMRNRLAGDSPGVYDASGALPRARDYEDEVRSRHPDVGYFSFTGIPCDDGTPALRLDGDFTIEQLRDILGAAEAHFGRHI